jgi:hypothetical protein
VRQALRIGGGLVAVGLVVYAVIAVSGGSGGTAKSPKRVRVTEARDSEGEGEDGDRSKRAAAKKPARDRDSKTPLAVDRKSLPVPGASTAPEPAPVRYEEAYDQFVALVDELDAMAARGEHLSQKEFVEIYRKGDGLSVALMRTPEVAASDDVRSRLAKLNQRFRMKVTEVGPVPAGQ